MLEFLRNKSSSWILKVILGLIIISFCYFGLSGIFQSRGGGNIVATVGDMDITKQQLWNELQKTLNLIQKETGKKISLQDLYKAGLVNQILEKIINSALLAQEIKCLKIVAPDEIVLDVIQKDPMFIENGKFSRQKFDHILAENRLNEAQYINSMRQKLAEVQLLSAISAAGYVPNTLLNAFFSTVYEKRQVAIMVPKIAIDSAKIKEAELEKFYESSKEKFRTPEYRSFKVLVLNPKDLLKHIKVTDAEVKSSYEQQKENFYDEDRRDILMIRIQDKKEAARIKAIAKQGKIETLADRIPLQNASRGDMPEEISDIAFKTPVGGLSDVVHVASMGQNFVVYVQKATAGGLKPYEQVKMQVQEDLRQQKAMDEMANLSHMIEDKIAANISFDKIAQEHHLQLIEVKEANVQGLQKNGIKSSSLLNEEMLKVAFETQVNMTSPIVEIEDAPSFVVQVDKVEPSIIPALENIKEKVKKLLIQKMELEMSISKVHAIIAELNAGKKINEIVKRIPSAIHSFTIDPSNPKTHETLDKETIAKLFSIAEAQHLPVNFEGQFALGQVTKIIPANADKGKIEMISKVLTVSTNEEIIRQYINALRAKHNVKVYQPSIASLVTMGEAQPAAQVPINDFQM